MKFNKKQFKKLVENANLIVQKNHEYNILKMINLDFNNSQLKITSSDIDNQYTGIINHDKIINKNIQVDAKKLLKIVKCLKNEEIEIDFNDDSYELIIKDNVKYKLAYENNDFPLIDKKYNNEFIINDQKIFFNIIKNVIFSTTKNNINPAYSGILFCNRDEKTDIVTTDIHRLSLVRTKVIHVTENIVLPVESSKNLIKIFNKDDIESSYFDSEKKFIKFESSNQCFISNLLKDEFPNYLSVFEPDNFDNEYFEIGKNELTEKINSIVSFFNDKKIITTKFEVKDDIMKIETLEDFSNIETEIKYRKNKILDHELGIIGINSKYVLDILKNQIIKKEIVKLCFKNMYELRPILFIENDNDFDFYHLIMPLKIKN